MTEFKTQVGNGEYRFQFETTDPKKYETMQHMARLMIDLESAEKKREMEADHGQE